ncbi:MAG: hypothetical protein ACLP9C_02825 [Acidimicrobiales bacterium]
MADTGDRPEIIECEIRLHTGRPAQGSGEPSWSDWAQTVVGEPVTFRAVAVTAKGAWNGPIPPGVEIAAPVALADPYWTVFLPAASGPPVQTGQVGRPLAIGEAFTLGPGEPDRWIDGVTFEGAIVID